MFAFLKHLFIPHESNNYKARSLHHDFLTGLIAILLLLNVTFKVVLKNFDSNVLGASTDITIQALVDDTNAERTKAGLKPLRLNTKLNLAAQDKANDMFANDYWAHFSPTGTSPWFFFEKEEYHYLYAGENLAKDFSDSGSIVNAWMNSEKHRENILKPDYEEVGYAIKDGTLMGQPTVLVVQLFGTQDPAFADADSAPEKTVAQETGKKVVPVKQTARTQVPQVASIQKKPLIDIRSLQKQLMFIVLMGFIFVLAIDLYFVEKRGMFQLSGKHVAHLVFIIFFILSIVTVSSGLIL